MSRLLRLLCFVVVASACALPPSPPVRVGVAGASLSGLTVAQGELLPTFAPTGHDYAIICPAEVTRLDITAVPTSPTSTVRYDRTDANGVVRVHEDSLVTITVVGSDNTVDRYFLRCLPHDFPRLTASTVGAGPQPGWYPLALGLGNPAGTYFVSIVDERGAVLWYKRSTELALDFKRSPSGTAEGTLLWSTSRRAGQVVTTAVTERDLSGSILHTWRTVGADTDNHDSLRLVNGNTILGGLHLRTQVDVGALEPAFTGLHTVADMWLQELTPDGTVAWEWRSEDHIGVGETTAHLDGVSIVMPNGALDLVHWNSVAVDGDGDLIISMRHTDSVYKIRRRPGQPDDGKIVWKLGGNAPAEPGAVHLKLVDDPYSGPARQHDPRLLPNGHLTLYDDRTNKAGQPSRGIEYALDESSGTATLVQEFPNEKGTNACCLGSMRRTDVGSTVVGWGLTKPLLTEYDESGAKVLELTEPDGAANYRAPKEPAWAFDRAQLRATAGGTLVPDP